MAKARSAVPISAAISAKRATQTNSKINATLVGATHPGISNSLLGDEEVLDCFGDFFGMCFQREVAGVEETDGGIWNVAFEGLGT